MKKLLLGCAITALATSSAYAQSTGSNAIENSEIIVTGSRASTGVQGIVIPDVPKTRSIITQDLINRQTAGQSVLQIINQIPGVNYTNTDPYGSSGGNLRIRGFPGNRIALLWDGLPLNDTGNYAIYGNQTMDSELIERISVNLGTTDVDSPTPSAAGGVVSYQTIVPTREFGVIGDGSFGSLKYYRGFVKVETGELWSGGPRAWASGSDQQYDKFRGPGDLHKTQYNFRVYQDLATNGDFVSVAGHFNRNRNNSYNSGLASDYAIGRYFDNIPNCVRAGRGAGAQNDGTGATTGNITPGSCTNYYGLRINPSNTANVRGSMRLTLADSLILTVDPGWQYTLANGGGTTTIAENDLRLRASAAGAATTGVDLNGDNDVLDFVRVYQPSNTRTNRYTVLSSLIYQLNDQNRLRVAYTFDRGEHRQTGEFGRVDDFGNPLSVFGGKYDTVARIVSLSGNTLQNRDRYSVALLNQFSGEYFGRFFEDRLTVTAGVRAPFFKRELNQYCFTQVSSGNVYCGVQPAGSTIVAPTFTGTGSATPPTGNYYAPFARTIKYSPILPSAGVSFNLTPVASIYASYGRNFSAPSTDNLYRSTLVTPKGETTDSYEAGVRYRGSRIQAQVSGYWTDYKDRIVSAADVDPASPTFGTSIDRNVGSARARGFDAQVAVQPVRPVTLSGFLSYTDTRIKNDVLGANGAVLVRTGGARFVETPKWQYGGRAQIDFDPFSAAVQVKYVGKRWSTDDNGRTLSTVGTGGQTVGQLYVLTTATGASINTTGLPINSAGQTSGYTLVDLDARVNLERIGLAKTYFSVSVNNVFDKYYFGNISTQSTLSGGPRYSIGSPRTIQGTVRVGF